MGPARFHCATLLDGYNSEIIGYILISETRCSVSRIDVLLNVMF